jgi:hypothetical protein
MNEPALINRANSRTNKPRLTLRCALPFLRVLNSFPRGLPDPRHRWAAGVWRPASHGARRRRWRCSARARGSPPSRRSPSARAGAGRSSMRWPSERWRRRRSAGCHPRRSWCGTRWPCSRWCPTAPRSSPPGRPPAPWPRRSPRLSTASSSSCRYATRESFSPVPGYGYRQCCCSDA